MSPGSQVVYVNCSPLAEDELPPTAFWPWEVRYHILAPPSLTGRRTLCGHKWCHPWRTIYVDNRAPTCGKCRARV